MKEHINDTTCEKLNKSKKLLIFHKSKSKKYHTQIKHKLIKTPLTKQRNNLIIN